ncbi:MAG: hypothetical protein M0Q92_14995 [Methanoregula sp.]|jgi:hypothetical protein|nr:hypothetical protein [Methanoregula sp.]
MDDSAAVWTLPGVLGLIAVVLIVLAIIVTVGWAAKCGMGSTSCDCSAETVPLQCNYQCYESWACTCDDLDDMKAVRDNIDTFVAQREAEGSGSAGSDDGSAERAGQRDWLSGGKIAGLNDNGEIWIADSVYDNHCQDVVESVYLHEQVHTGDDTCRNPLTFLTGIFGSMGDSNYAQSLHDKSEFSAYGTQTAYLNQRIAVLEGSCNTEYRCSYSDELFDNRFNCIDACPCSLAHPCAGIPPCIEQNKDTGEPTGQRY